jgi:hypothetical protein
VSRPLRSARAISHASRWLSLGPNGTGALGLLLLGEQAPHVLIAFGRTLHGAYHGHLFVSPCLSDGKAKHEVQLRNPD